MIYLTDPSGALQRHHFSWPAQQPVWEFNIRQSGVASSEGLVFDSVRFKGQSVLYKASLPMIRVQYDVLPSPFGGLTHGPLKDSLHAYNTPLSVVQNGLRVELQLPPIGHVEGTDPDGKRFIRFQSYHTIGNYRITNTWTFRDDGAMFPQLFSAGLQFPTDHRHHAYWRLDFDIDGSLDNLALYRLAGSSRDSYGFGPGWVPIKSEGSFGRRQCSQFAVVNTRTKRGYVLLPGGLDFPPDGFSKADLWVHLFHQNEDRQGLLGSGSDDELDSFAVNPENVENKDVVLWYCAHLHHEVADGADEAHVCGPLLIPFGY